MNPDRSAAVRNAFLVLTGGALAASALTNTGYVEIACIGLAVLVVIASVKDRSLLLKSRTRTILVWLVVWALVEGMIIHYRPAIELGPIGRTGYFLSLLAEYGAPFCLFVLIPSTSLNWKRWRLLGYFYLAGCMASALTVLATWGRGTIGEYGERLSVGIVNPNYIAYCLATALPVLWALYMQGGGRRQRWPIQWGALGLGGVLSFSLLLTGSRGGWMALTIVLVVVCVSLLRSNLTAGILVTGFIVTAAAGAYLVLPASAQSRIYLPGLGGAEIDSAGRYAVWYDAGEMFQENPIAGSGPGSVSQKTATAIQAHNAFLSIGAELGLVGLLIYLVAVFRPFSASFRRGSVPWARSFGLAAAGVWFTIAFTGVWEFSVPAWFVFAWMEQIPRLSREFWSGRPVPAGIPGRPFR